MFNWFKKGEDFRLYWHDFVIVNVWNKAICYEKNSNTVVFSNSRYYEWVWDDIKSILKSQWEWKINELLHFSVKIEYWNDLSELSEHILDIQN